MMLPILISVSVAPVSYFFWASAPLTDALNTASAATGAIMYRLAIKGIAIFLRYGDWDVCMSSAFLDEKLLVILVI
jgi:hypothetical protein